MTTLLLGGMLTCFGLALIYGSSDSKLGEGMAIAMLVLACVIGLCFL